MKNRLPSLQYRPSIDGMRTIAVVAVMLFHLNENLLPGGFVGVDVFFVISGYLITSIIYRDCQNGDFSLSRFYQRRVARIIPVFFVVALAILFAASILYTSQDFASAGALSAAAALSIVNLKLMLQGNYFQLSPDSQPFLHFWSLSVEEQFYIFWPFTLVIAHKLRFSRKALLSCLWLIALASFVGCIFLTSSKPTWAFYLLPTRAWELFAGAILAIHVSNESKRESHWSSNWLSALGFLLIVISFFTIRGDNFFPGYIAIVPVLGTVLLIGRSHHSQQLTERMLSQPIMVFLGKLSYSLYLWHWPVYCFVDYSLYTESFAIRTTIKVVLTLILSLLSYAIIEKPTRVFLNQSSRKRLVFVGLTVGIIALVSVGSFIRSSNYISASLVGVPSGGVEFASSSDSPTVVLVGDSNGSMYGMVMKDIADETDLNVNVISVSAENPFPPNKLYTVSMDFLARKKPEITVFAALWTGTVCKEGGRQKLEGMLSEMLKHTSHVVLISQPPTLPEGASRETFRNNGMAPIFEDAERASLRAQSNETLLSFESERIHVLDVESLFKQSDGQIKFSDERGRGLFQDQGHLSGYGADLVRQPLVTKILSLLSSE